MSTEGVRSSNHGRYSVRELLEPKNVVILGASPGRGGDAPLGYRELLKMNGFEGAVYLLNPKYDEIFGETCYPSFKALPEPPDHVLVAIPRGSVAASLEEATKCGARSATIISAGFGEGDDPEGHRLAIELREMIERTGLAVSGPNCLGNRYAWSKLATLNDPRLPDLEPGPVAIVGQSGGVVTAIGRSLADRGISVGAILSTGNEIGLKMSDYLDFFADHPEVRIVICYVEAIREIGRFLEACDHLRKMGKVCLMYKVGGSDAAREAALAHTGSLVGSREAFEAVAKEAGVVPLQTLDEVVEAAEFLAHAPCPAGDRIALMTISGGLKGVVLGSAETIGLTLPQPSEETSAKHFEILGVGTSVGNPLDSGYTGMQDLDAYLQCVDIFFADGGYDALLLQEELPRASRPRKERYLAALDEVAANRAPIPIALVTIMSHSVTDYGRALRREKFPHLPFLQEPTKALSVVAALGANEARRRRIEAAPASIAEELPPVALDLQEVFDAALMEFEDNTDGGRDRPLTESAAKRLISVVGIEVPRERIAANEAEAVAVAREFGGHVVLKIVSTRATHKAKVGGVFMNLFGDDDVRLAYGQAQRVQRDIGEPAERAGTVLIAEQIDEGVDLAVGAKLDPEFGSIVMVGIGGALVELSGPPACVRAAAPRVLIREIVETSTAARLLDSSGYGEQIEQLTSTVEQVAQLVIALGSSLSALDINPLRFCPSHRSGIALDGLAIVTPA